MFHHTAARPPAKIRILLADGYVLVRECMRLLLETKDDMEVVAEVSTGHTAVRKAAELSPDIVIIEASLPLIPAVSTILRIRRDAPTIKIIAFAASNDEQTIREMRGAGAACYASERCTGSNLVKMIRALAAGITHVDDGAKDGAKSVDDGFAFRGGIDSLTERETSVLRRIAQGYGNKEIAAHLDLSIKTVETYRGRAMEKAGLDSRVDIMRYAVRHGWLGNDQPPTTTRGTPT